MAIPNTYIIGIQKAGTTTFHSWLSQHPEVYGPDEYKDHGFFIRENDIEKIRINLDKAFCKPTSDQSIILHSHVNYIFYEEVLERINAISPDARFIVILRNPVKRAFSSYHYFRKMLREKRSIEKAFDYEPEFPRPFSKDNSDLTYIEHGLYSLQLSNFFKYFRKEQILILDFEDLKKSPELVLNKVYDYLKIDKSFIPSLISENVTGNGTKSEFVQKQLFSSNPVKKIIISVFIDWWLPREKRKLIVNKILDLNTKQNQTTKQKSKIENSEEIQAQLTSIYKEDVEKLDKLLGTDFKDKWKLN